MTLYEYLCCAKSEHEQIRTGGEINLEKILAKHTKVKEIFDFNTGYTPGKKSNTKSSLLVVEIFFLDKGGEVKEMNRIGTLRILTFNQNL